MSHGGTGKQGQRDEKSAKLKRSSVACVMSDTWRRKIKLVPTRTECQKNWTCSATKLLSLSLKDRKEVALLLRHCTCIQIFSIQAYLTDHLALLLFNSINLPHGPLEAIMISPPPSTRLPHHPQKEDRRKNFLLTTRLLCTHVGRSRARWLVSNWRVARSTPTQRASPAFHWENSCSPSFLPSL